MSLHRIWRPTALHMSLEPLAACVLPPEANIPNVLSIWQFRVSMLGNTCVVAPLIDVTILVSLDWLTFWTLRANFYDIQSPWNGCIPEEAYW